jgi:VWFA-related protein
MSTRVFALLVTLTLVGMVRADTTGQERPTYRTGIRTVPVFATVVDARGQLVPELGQRDFSIIDNGKPAVISLFSNAQQPFTAVVMLDTSASMTANLTFLNRAAEQFLLQLLPDDRAQVGAFNDKIQLSGTFTNSAKELTAELTELDIGNPTRLYDGIAASLDALRGIDGRRVVLVFTDGDDTASRIGFKNVLERARDEEVMVYAIGLESEYFNGSAWSRPALRGTSRRSRRKREAGTSSSRRQPIYLQRFPASPKSCEVSTSSGLRRSLWTANCTRSKFECRDRVSLSAHDGATLRRQTLLMGPRALKSRRTPAGKRDWPG